ncbi:MAG: fluoride efflux transporter CrcB [Cyclobacteriaceae bacterium]
MNLVNVLLVGAGGCIGSMARYLAVISIDKKLNSAFPLGTLTVNLLGSFALGFLMAVLMNRSAHGLEWRLFLGTGFCGGFTTFSAFALENMNLFQQKSPGMALMYIIFSVAGGIAAVWTGVILGRNII